MKTSLNLQTRKVLYLVKYREARDIYCAFCDPYCRQLRDGVVIYSDRRPWECCSECFGSGYEFVMVLEPQSEVAI
jgi:hypothetical protein